MSELREHGGRHFAVQFHYVLPDDAWCIELSEAVLAPTSWADIPGSVSHVPGPAFVVALVPDEDLLLEPTIHIQGHDEHVIPYEIMCWFMEKVAGQVEHCRAVLSTTGSDAGADAGSA